MEPANSTENKTHWLQTPLSKHCPGFTIETLLVILIILAAVVTRFYQVGLRVMSHDEVNHVVPSYELYQGRGYSHDPITHGPLQFHLVAASYFLLGDSDFTSRVPAALFSIATIVFVLFAYRRYLGRTGALLAGLFFLISPYMMFYGRYTRNEAFVAFFGVIMLYAVLRYLETGQIRILYLFTTVLALQFVTKETSFIYAAELLIFLALLFLRDVIRKEWSQPKKRDSFVFAMLGAFLFAALALAAALMNTSNQTDVADAVAAAGPYHWILLGSLLLAILSAVVALVVLIRSLSWRVVKEVRSFDLLILTISLILPQLIALPINLAGFNPLDYSQSGLVRTSLFLAGAVLISLAMGMVWKPRVWVVNISIFYAIFTLFYTTFFTNGQGFFTGLVGALGYWLTQQSVNRGSQPWFFFAFLQIPMYEYLPAIGTIVALVIGWKHKLFSTLPGLSPLEQVRTNEIVPLASSPEEEMNPAAEEIQTPEVMEENPATKIPVLALLLFWSVMSLIAYTLAGEKMPWLTVHITLPMLLCAGFGFGYVIDSLSIRQFVKEKALLILITLPIFLISLGTVLGSLLGNEPPFAGKELAQLQATSTFLFGFLALIASGGLLAKWLAKWSAGNLAKLLLVGAGAILTVLTARSALQASFINYDNAREFLVYAHGARGPKDVFEQVEEISKRTTGGKNIQVAYIGDALYPYWWYFRDYPNKVWLEDNLTRDLLNYPIVISDDDHYSKTQAILKDGYYETKYTRLVWPMQDYFNLTWQKVWDGITNPEMRQAIFNIWLNKDYTLYSTLTGNTNLTLETWQPSVNIYLFIKKDIASQIWTYGVLPTQPEVTETDPYAARMITLTPDKIVGSAGSAEGQLSAPRDIAIANDGSIYIADSLNHRIQRFSAEGEFLQAWGTYASIDSGNAPGGTFNEPWGVAVGADGSVYVADTWNHRIQKFSADGAFVLMWGVPGLAEQPDQFWGPRGIAVGPDGNVYITDTGNNRVAVFDGKGKFITQFGVNGMGAGEFDEPVGIAVDEQGYVYVADTWNQRVQVFKPDGTGGFSVDHAWSVSGWNGQSITNKPFLALNSENHVLVTDPDGFRVLEFDQDGNFVRGWGDYSSGIDGFGAPIGIAVDNAGHVWVGDGENNYALRFTLPAEEAATVGSDLPIIPEGMIYDDQSGLLLNEAKMPVYRLSSDGKDWVPIVSEGVAGLLPANSQPEKDDLGNWILKDAQGVPVFQWDPLTYTWIAVKPTP
ncbi:MAG: flippase activity-associated protein Agl23 [Anaerolineaceae bacterium]